MIIRQKDKDKIILIAKNTLQTPCKLLAYGSRVNGEAHDTSDLDMVLVSKDDKKIDIDELIDFKEKLQDSTIPILIQISDWYRIPQSFHKNILRNCEEIVSVD
jgi:predicted nucleotidyltransferase